jgi:Mn-dependent DtxR family transcriptional regulator
LKELTATLLVPRQIISNHDLDDLEKLIMIVYVHFGFKKWGIKFSNKWLADNLGSRPNTIGDKKRSLINKGYIKQVSSKEIELTDKLYTAGADSKDKRDFMLPKEVYQLNITHGAKLLWSIQNSNSEGKKWSSVNYGLLASNLDCGEKSIGRWHKTLEENGLIESKLKRIEVNKTAKLVNTLSFVQKRIKKPNLTLNEIDKLYRKFLGEKSGFNKKIKMGEVSIHLDDLISAIEDSENPTQTKQALIFAIQSSKRSLKLKDHIVEALHESLK